jgi:hypothetical protein
MSQHAVMENEPQWLNGENKFLWKEQRDKHVWWKRSFL